MRRFASGGTAELGGILVRHSAVNLAENLLLVTKINTVLSQTDIENHVLRRKAEPRQCFLETPRYGLTMDHRNRLSIVISE